MKPPAPKTIHARGRNDNNLNSESRPPNDDTNLFETHPAPLGSSDSEGDSAVPLIKRRRMAAMQSAMECNALSKPTMVDHALNHFTMEDDGFMMTVSAELAPVHRGLTPGVSERMGSILSSTQVDSTPRKPLATALLDIARRAFFDMAHNRLLTYAGPNTEELEGRYFQWQQSGKQHDKFCLICFYTNTDLACRTCKRVYHILCLKPGLIAEQADGSFFCPLCTKRTWSEEPPSRDLDPERRLLALVAQLQNIGAMAAWIQLKDTGEALDDRNLLYEMGVTTKDVAEEASRSVASCTTPQTDTSLNSPDVKQEQVKEEAVEAQRSDEWPSEDPPANEDQLQYVHCICGRYQLSDDETRDMICCDECNGWQHLDCMGLAIHYNPNQYFCKRCRPQDHAELLAAKARNEKPWELVSRQGLAQEQPFGSPNPDTANPTPQSDERLPDIPPLDSAVENTLSYQSPARAQRQKPRKSKAWPVKQPIGKKKRKRNSPRHIGDGMLRGDDAMKAFRKADSAATRDFYSYNRVSTHIPERLESSAQRIPSRQTFAELGLPLTFAPEFLPLHEELPEKHLRKLKKPCQKNPETGQAQRVSDPVLRSLGGSASPETGTPGQINGASIPESPTESTTKEDSSPKWQFYQPPTTDRPTKDKKSTQLPQTGLQRSPMPRPDVARSIPNNLQRPRQARGSHKKTMSAVREPDHPEPQPGTSPPPPPPSASTDRLLSTGALGRQLSAQPVIATLLDTYSPLSATTIDVIKRLERLKILAYEYGFLMRQLGDALPQEWPKKATSDASAGADADQNWQGVNGRRAGGRDRSV